MKFALFAQSTFLASLVLFAATVVAQPQGPRPEQPNMHGGPRNPEQRLQHLSQELDLSSEQTNNIKSILSAAESKCSGSSDPRAFHECMLGQHVELDAAIEAELNSEQTQKFLELRQQRPRPRIGGGAGQADGPARGPFPPARD